MPDFAGGVPDFAAIAQTYRLSVSSLLGAEGSGQVNYLLWSIWTRKIQVCTFLIFNF